MAVIRRNSATQDECASARAAAIRRRHHHRADHEGEQGAGVSGGDAARFRADAGCGEGEKRVARVLYGGDAGYSGVGDWG
jgi:hypothetical protein